MNTKIRQNEFIAFSIDEIYLNDLEKEVFSADIIPEFDATYFPPNLLKSISFQKEMLEKEMYYSIMRKYRPEVLQDEIDITFLGQVVQGGFYKVNKKNISMNLLNPNTIISLNNDIFNGTKLASPYKDRIEYNSIQNFGENIEELSLKQEELHPELRLYCFNVGQGDCMLVITPTGCVYIIDTNFYSKKSVENFISDVKDILKKNNLSDKKIRALIVTHKHIDHIRGTNVVLDKNDFDIEYFLINHDYKHELKSVKMLLDAAKSIPRWINVNKRGVFKDGEVMFEIINPDIDTYSKEVAPDMNDNSISIKVSYGNDIFFLTGDTGHNYLEAKLPIHVGTGDAILKVSHHGSRTGTSNKMLAHINPKYAFISVGNSKKYKHPNKEVVNILENKIGKLNLDISKKLQVRRLYVSTGKGILRSTW